MKELWINLLEFFGLAWWIEIITESPKCTYYFGPFANAEDAKAEQAGYIDDLEQEGAKGIRVAIKRCRPNRLTISDEMPEPSTASRSNIFPIFSNQLP